MTQTRGPLYLVNFSDYVFDGERTTINAYNFYTNNIETLRHRDGLLHGEWVIEYYNSGAVKAQYIDWYANATLISDAPVVDIPTDYTFISDPNPENIADPEPPEPPDPRGGGGGLFTPKRNTVNFNNLTPEQKTAVDKGANLYNALAENDHVTLPNTTSIPLTSKTWDQNQWFFGGTGIDFIKGGTLDDKINGGPGSDTLIGGGGVDTAALSGRPSDYIIKDHLRSILASETTIKHKGTGETDTITEFERFQFNNPLSTNAVTWKNAYLEMARLSNDAYQDGPISRGWRPLHAHELELPIRHEDGWTLANGVYRNGPAVAHVYVANGKAALAFRGTDAFGRDVVAWTDAYIDNYYKKFEPLVKAFKAYVSKYDIDQVLVTGHSLGGAMAQAFMGETFKTPGSDRYVAATVGSIGYALGHRDDRIVHFEHTDDIARKIQNRTGDFQGEIVRISVDFSEQVDKVPEGISRDSSVFGEREEHRQHLYVETLTNLVLAGPEMSGLLTVKNRQPGSALHWAVGDNGNNLLFGDDYRGEFKPPAGGLNETLLGLKGNDRLYGYKGDDTLKGGQGVDALYGGEGKDVLIGGADRDVFSFLSIDDSQAGIQNRDVISDFESRTDAIRLSLIDAEKGSGNQRFHWVDKGDLDATFTKDAGELRFAKGILSGDINGDGKADFEIKIMGSFAAGDVIM